MRNGTDWRTPLVQELAKLAPVYGKPQMELAHLLDTELILTLMADYLPNEQPMRAWVVLNGYRFKAFEALSPAARQAIAIARLRLPEPLGRRVWERRLAQYQKLPQVYSLYQLQAGSLIRHSTSILPERLDAMRTALKTAPAWKKRLARYASPSRYRFYISREAHEVELPASTATSTPIPSFAVSKERVRPPLRICLKGLQDEADWMDQNAPSGVRQQWGQRIRKIRLSLVGPTGLTESPELTVDGVLHLLGMVGSGKSTLFTVLAVHLARQGQRVVMVAPDVATLLRTLAVFEALCVADSRLSAVPLVGRSTRLIHLNRLHAVEARTTKKRLGNTHPGYAMFSTVCPLDGLRHDVAPIPPTEEPCTRLYAIGTPSPQSFDCPFLPVCPVHHPTRQMLTANIWLATPASLLASRPQAPLVSEKMRYIEMVMRSADVVLLDEADLVQVQFDDRFAPTEVLVGRHGHGGWLDRLAQQVSRQIYRPGRPLVGRSPALDHWLTVHDNTQRAVNRLYKWLRKNDSTRRWLGQSYFSGKRLLQRVETEFKAENARMERFLKVRYAWGRRALGSGRGHMEGNNPVTPWIAAVGSEIFEADSEMALAILRSWIQGVVPAGTSQPKVERLADHLLFALIVSFFDYALQEVLAEWQSVSDMLDLDRGSGNLFHQPSDALVRLVPEAPMGAVLGFQYHDVDSTGDGSLRFFHLRGVGRFLLTHLHHALSQSDGLAGPHVILTSATSWAPSSWRYHLDVEPGAVLLPIKQEESAELSCFFEPISDPEVRGKSLYVSGRQSTAERLRNLRAMVQHLARPQAFNPSPFEQELAKIEDPERRRILLLVGSYEQASEVARVLADVLKDQGKLGDEAEVLALVPDRQPGDEWAWQTQRGTFLRSMLPQLSQFPTRFLVAPLQAIERGHNILVEQTQKAAFGSVYFLVRPVPPPGDLNATVHRINTWALNQLTQLNHSQIGEAGLALRRQATVRWDELLREKETYRYAKDRDALLWTQLVLVWQCIGRLLRGGVYVRVHFIDGKWAEGTARLLDHQIEDTPQTSMLLGFERILQDALADSDPVRRALTESLYGPFAKALAAMKTVRRA